MSAATHCTSSQTVGPFFHDCLLRARRAAQRPVRARDAGERIRDRGARLRRRRRGRAGRDDRDLAGQHHGRYNHPADRRDCRSTRVSPASGAAAPTPTAATGSTTIKPGAVPFDDRATQAPHICVAVFARGLLNHLYTRLYFADEPANADDPVLRCVPAERRATLLAPADSADGEHAVYRFDIVLQGAGETVFFNLVTGVSAMTDFLSLPDAIAAHVHDGSTVALEGFTHLIPFAAGHEIIRQRQARPDADPHDARPDLRPADRHGLRAQAGLLLGRQPRRRLAAPAARRGRARLAAARSRSRSTATRRWRTPTPPARPACPARSCAATRAPTWCGINPNIRSVTCPFTGEQLAAVPAIRPDVAIIHAQRADRAGNVLIEGIIGVQKEVVLAAQRAIVTVEEVVDDLRAPSPNSVVLPHWTVSAVVVAPGGARPSYAHGYYGRDNAFYTAWDAIARDRDTFLAGCGEHVLDASTDA